jgi:hypothetical protein
MILVEPYVNFLVEYDLTQEQLLFLHLVYAKRTDLIQLYKKKFPNPSNAMISTHLIQDLVKKDFLVVTSKGVKLGNTFLSIFVDGNKAVDEIFDAYPSFVRDNQGVQIPLTAMDKKVFREIYMPKIMGNLEEHKEVIKDIEYGVKNNAIRMGINKFLTSEFWKTLRKERIAEFSIISEKSNKLDEDF